MFDTSATSGCNSEINLFYSFPCVVIREPEYYDYGHGETTESYESYGEDETYLSFRNDSLVPDFTRRRNLHEKTLLHDAASQLGIICSKLWPSTMIDLICPVVPQGRMIGTEPSS